jgi:hypothetical protein
MGGLSLRGHERVRVCMDQLVFLLFELLADRDGSDIERNEVYYRSGPNKGTSRYCI